MIGDSNHNPGAEPEMKIMIEITQGLDPEMNVIIKEMKEMEENKLSYDWSC